MVKRFLFSFYLLISMIELLNSRSTNEHKLSWKIPYIFDGSGTLSATLMTVQSSSEQGDND